MNSASNSFCLLVRDVGTSVIILIYKSPNTFLEEKQRRLKEQKRKMLNATGFGSNIFEGTEPISQGGSPDSPGQSGALAGVDPSDAGVDLSGIMSVSGRSWKDMI